MTTSSFTSRLDHLHVFLHTWTRARLQTTRVQQLRSTAPETIMLDTVVVGSVLRWLVLRVLSGVEILCFKRRLRAECEDSDFGVYERGAGLPPHSIHSPCIFPRGGVRGPPVKAM